MSARRTFTLGMLLLLLPVVLNALAAQTGRELYDEATKIERTMGPHAAIPLYQRVLALTPDTARAGAAAVGPVPRQTGPGAGEGILRAHRQGLRRSD
jgi:hypothetical protein